MKPQASDARRVVWQDLDPAQLSPGDRFVVALDANATAHLSSLAAVADRPDEIGAHTLELECAVVARIERPGRCEDARVGLIRPKRLLSTAQALRRTRVAMPLDNPQCIAISRAKFTDRAQIDQYFAKRSGRWLIVDIGNVRFHARRAHDDLFTRDLPTAGSYIVDVLGTARGLVTGPREPWVVEWVRANIPSGYYMPFVAERCALIAQGVGLTADAETTPREVAIGDVRVYAKRADGRVACWASFDNLVQAQRWAKQHAGCWLLATIVDKVPVL
ncbi:MAG: hypothetical protein H6707_17870 [Deltaproteobacteria bacterium]|nr:hypothetical protein [Deltaproteobacteria bacterium]